MSERLTDDELAALQIDCDARVNEWTITLETDTVRALVSEVQESRRLAKRQASDQKPQ